MRLALTMCMVFLLTSGLVSLGFYFAENEAAPADANPGNREEGKQPEIALLVERIYNPDRVARRQAIQSLVDLGLDARLAMPAMIDALRDDDESIRILAARGLGRMGPTAKAALPALNQAMMDRSHAVLEEASQAVRQIDTNPSSTEN